MVHNYFRVNILRKHLYKDNVLFLQGCFLNGEAKKNTIKVLYGEEEVSFQEERKQGYFVKQKYLPFNEDITTELNAWIEVSTLSVPKTIKVINCEDGNEQVALEFSSEELKEAIDRVDFNIDTASRLKSSCEITGWVMYQKDIEICVMNTNGKKLKSNTQYLMRKDVLDIYSEVEDKEKKCGFKIICPSVKDNSIHIVIKADGRQVDTVVDLKQVVVVPKQYTKRAVKYFKQYGFKKFVRHSISKCKQKLFTKVMHIEENNYNYWMEKYDIKEAELAKQKKKTFKKDVKFSIIVPLYNTPKKYLEELIDSVEKQTYGNWELCFADGSTNEALVKFFDELCKNNKRIKYKKLTENRGIAGNTNEALLMAEGEYIVLGDHDDLFAPHALFETAEVIEKYSDADVIYSDEDKIDMDGKLRFEPHFKPDFNIDLLCSVNYICHMFVVRRQIAINVGMFNQEYDGAQDYDFIFKCVENARNVYHIPKILYHWRCHPASTAANPESKLYAFEAGKKAIQAHFDRVGIKAEVNHGAAYGLYHSKLKVTGNPLVSVLIPNKDHTQDLDICIKSIYNKTLYKNFEIIIIENNSTEKETFEYYEKIKKEYPGISVVTWDSEFNYSLINNFGAKSAKGEYLLLLNNDTEIISETWMEEMLGYCQREDVGIVGARLYYSDDTIQHAGVVIGFGGIAGHTFIGQGRYDYGYFARAMCTQDYSAVTAACLMTKKSVFDEVGGLTGELRVAFNDIDYCLKVRKTGKLVVYNPWAELYHYESKSRGLEDTPEKVERFNGEIEIFQTRWKDVLEKGDPYYNPNLSLNRSDFGLKG